MAPHAIEASTQQLRQQHKQGNAAKPMAIYEEDRQKDPIAIVGYSLRLSGDATTPDGFWDVLIKGRCTSTEVPRSRWSLDGFYHADNNRSESISTQKAHFIEEDIGAFDAPFFSISSSEAASIDPQQRHLLEATYHALENAGIPIERCSGSKTAVYTGCMSDDYRQMASKDPEQASPYTMTGVYLNLLADRISWFFNFKGASMTIDTACSSSLVALDVARQSLLSGDSKMAIVAGANLLLHADPLLFMTTAGLLSSDGRSFSFDERANGYARGEGVGVLVLKRLQDAIDDNDTIRAVIRSTGLSQDGKTPGITQPSERAQRELIQDTYKKAGLNFDHTRYFEAHGTGTAIGDPIETRALGSVFRKSRSPSDPLFVGSVKSNIGHTEGASGLAGVIKATMVLERGIIPPVADLQNINSRIDHEFHNISFPRTATPWPTPGLRRASVNSFGFGGSNAHIILDDAYSYLSSRSLSAHHSTTNCGPTSPRPPTYSSLSPQVDVESKNQKLVIFSAADEASIGRLAASYAQHFSSLKTSPQSDAKYWKDFLFTMNTRRSLLKCRSFAIASLAPELCQLESLIKKPVKVPDSPARLGFVFTGQGAQWAGMGLALLRFPVFERILRDAEYILVELGSPRFMLNELRKDDSSSQIQRPELSQPYCTALQLALVELLCSFGIRPDVVVGHSSGEIAAAYCAGAISFHSALKLAYHRGLLASSLKEASAQKGAMLATGISSSDAEPYLAGLKSNFGSLNVVVACINSPKSITISGDEEQIDHMQSSLVDKGHFARKLMVDVAYHSPHMKQIATKYYEAIVDIEIGYTPKERPITIISSVTGDSVSMSQLQKPQYWVDNLCQPVQFCKAIQHCLRSTPPAQLKIDRSHLFSARADVFVEIGPHSTLKGPLRDIMNAESRAQQKPYFPTVLRNSTDYCSILEVAGSLWSQGHPVKLNVVNCEPAKSTRESKVLTDLPSYPFDHSRSYWHEGRFSRNFRLQEQPKLDLLGKPVSDWNPLLPRWRNHIRVSQLPWVADHQVNSLILYPAAGMLVMAIEAVAQITSKNSDQEIFGFVLTDITFSAALQISSDSTAVETQLCLRPLKELSDDNVNYYEFQLFGFEIDKVTECCNGRIQIHLQTERACEFEKETSTQFEAPPEYPLVFRNCNRSVNSQQLYQCLHKSGLEFGPQFQCIRNAFSGPNSEICGEIPIYQWPINGTSNTRQPHVVHPITLDGMMHLLVAAMTNGGQNQIPTVVPMHIKRLWLSRSGLSYLVGESISAAAQVNHRGNRDIEGTVTVMNSTGDARRAQIDGLSLRIVSDIKPNLTGDADVQQQCFTVDYRPDPASLTTQNIESLTPRKPEEDSVKFYRSLSLVIGAYIVRTIDYLKNIAIPHDHPHFWKYIDWMQWQLSRGPKAEWEVLSKDEARFRCLREEISAANPQGKLSVAVGDLLPQMLSGRLDPLEMMVQDDMLKNFYQDVNDRSYCWSAFSVYLDALAHQKPNLRILEIGAGTGGSTRIMLNVIEKPGQPPRYAEYTFTDISAAFFEKAREEFNGPNMQFKRLNIEQDPEDQGFKKGTYDIVLAANVLHATKSLSETVRNARALLKPGGKLILFEITATTIPRTGFFTGLLPGWWLSGKAAERHGPCLEIDQWRELLVESGFSGVDMALGDFESPKCHEMDIMISTAQEEAGIQGLVNEVFIVADIKSECQMAFAKDVQAHLSTLSTNRDGKIIISTLEEALDSCDRDGTCYVLMQELDRPFLASLGSTTFDLVRTLLTSAKTILWLSRSSTGDNIQPYHGATDGLSRVLRNENSARFVSLKLDIAGALKSHQLEKITQILASSWEDEDTESTYPELDGIFQVSRLIETKKIKGLTETEEKQPLTNRPFGSEGSMKLTVTSPGSFDSLCFVRDEQASLPLGADEVEIKVYTAGLTCNDCLTASGTSREANLGAEVAGIINRIGDKVDSVKVGDRVLALVTNGFATFARSKASGVVKLPDSIPFEEAAALPVTFFLAYRALVDVARVEEGEKVLIHHGASGVGQAAIQLARMAGARVLTTVGSTENRKLLIERYGIPESDMFSSQDTSFSQKILKIHCAVDVVLNSLSGPGLQASWECIAPYGRFIEIGKKDIMGNTGLPMAQFEKSVTFASLDACDLALKRPKVFRETMHKVLDLVIEKKLEPAWPLTVYSVGDIQEAFRQKNKGEMPGKIVVRMEEMASVPMIIDSLRSIMFDPAKTYLIAGGLGGLGRSIATWMSERGARNLVLLSRSGVQPKTAEFISSLEKRSVTVYAPACDVADPISLAETLKEATKRMPPIAGCIQASMVLRDSLFKNMSFSDWKSSIRPKILGSWNLHSFLPSNLDFFILLSSLTGLTGQGGQANYAAGNSYQDALARYRVSRGQKAVSLDLGVMGNSGFLVENTAFMSRMMATGCYLPLSDTNLFTLLSHYCNPNLTLSPNESQLAIGIDIPSNLSAKNIDIPPFMRTPLFSHLHQMKESASDLSLLSSSSLNDADSTSSSTLTHRLAKAPTLSDAGAIVTQALVGKLARGLALEERDVDPSKPLPHFGVDSLLAIELRSWIGLKFGADLPVFSLLGAASLAAVGVAVAERSEYRREEGG